MSAIAEMIAVVRDARRMTQEQLSEAAGVGQGYISMIQRSKRIPSDEKLASIAEALGCPVELLRADAPLRGRQGVGPIESLKELAHPELWDSDEEYEQFIADLYNSRHS